MITAGRGSQAQRVVRTNQVVALAKVLELALAVREGGEVDVPQDFELERAMEALVFALGLRMIGTAVRNADSEPIVWLKNIGSSDATKVFDSLMMDSPRLVALKKTGNPHVNGWPTIDDSTCHNISQDPRFMAFPIYAAEEFRFDSMRGETIASKPALPKRYVCRIGLVLVFRLLG